MSTALTTLEGIACHDSPEFPVFTRLAGCEGNIYLDLADDQWRVVEITPNGWGVLTEPPIRFRRAIGMRALPLPIREGELSELKQVINVRESDWPLFAAWVVQAARDRGPYPVLALYGEQGSAKSTATRLLRSLIDPNQAPLRAPPREIRDLAIAATNSWILAFDNLSYLPNWLSDALCVLSTGGGFAARTLYTDDEESIFSFRRPVIINGIAEVAERSDLLDRCIPVTLQAIGESRRLTEEEIDAEFSEMHPRILGAVLDATSAALRCLPATYLTRKPRMADFAKWAVAAEPAMNLPEGEFLRAYARSRSEAVEMSVDGTLGQWVRALATKGGFRGTATELFDLADDKLRRASDWPKSGRSLAAELRRLVPGLRTLGLSVEFRKESSRAARRLIIIGSLDDSGSESSDSSDIPSTYSSQVVASDEPTNDRTMVGRVSKPYRNGSDASDHARADLSPCSICGLHGVCKACREQSESSDNCSAAGCPGVVFTFDADGAPKCQKHSELSATLTGLGTHD